MMMMKMERSIINILFLRHATVYLREKWEQWRGWPIVLCAKAKCKKHICTSAQFHIDNDGEWHNVAGTFTMPRPIVGVRVLVWCVRWFGDLMVQKDAEIILCPPRSKVEALLIYFWFLSPVIAVPRNQLNDAMIKLQIRGCMPEHSLRVSLEVSPNDQIPWRYTH